MNLRFGSVCSGIEAASVAWHSLGWKAAWLAEIEKFPSAALAHHYPDVPNYGDMTALPERIRSGEVEAPDVFCGGTPCQAFSVAGNRRSLDDARGNLSLTFCEIANAIDSVRYVRGSEPAIIFWENVPGVLNTADNAFGCFLAGLAGESVPLEPPGGKWTNAGCVLGPTRAVAWRVFDAQYFGLAQRRQRVFVVASARNGFDPAAVLFESEGVRRDTPPSREARQSVAADVAGGAGDGLARCITTGEAKRQDWETCNILPVCAEISPTVTNGPPFSRTGNERVECEALVTYGIPGNWIGRAPENGCNQVTVSCVIDTTDPNPSKNQGGMAILQPATYQEVIGALCARDYKGVGNQYVNEGKVVTAQYAVRRLTPTECERLQGFSPVLEITRLIGCIDRQSKTVNVEIQCHKLQSSAWTAAESEYVQFANAADWSSNTSQASQGCHVALYAQSSFGALSQVLRKEPSEKSLCASNAEKQSWSRCHIQDASFAASLVPHLEKLAKEATNGKAESHQPTLLSLTDQHGNQNAAMFGGEITDIASDAKSDVSVEKFTISHLGRVTPTCDSPIAISLCSVIHATSSFIQSETPMENFCIDIVLERDYTNIPWRNKPEAPDGPRYKALGNSWAVPVVRWIGRRIDAALDDLPW